MDISCRDFPNNLVRIIRRIANSHFVALDLEFSGIYSHRNQGYANRLTLQQVYEQTKEAATRYQVLQVGLTIVNEDVQKGMYTTRPYNFHINPVPAKEEYHGLERTWSFQSGAVTFLLRNKFHFEQLFTDGIPYLSRKEEGRIRASWAVRDAQKAAIEDMLLKVEDQPLVDHIHLSVQNWLSQPLVERIDYLNIPHLTSASPKPQGIATKLNRYQIRLTHQIIRSGYPDLKTAGKVGFVRITVRNAEEEAEERLRQARYRELDVINAIEFRWLVEALCGGDISNIPERYFLAAMPTNIKPGEGGARYKKFIDDLQSKLKTRRRVLFGHNCFIDLVYLYAAFIGDLPERVQDFQQLIHLLFPAVVDTKYMASLSEELRFNSDLDTVEKKMRDEKGLVVDVPSAFDKYSWNERCHEAGYDGFMTAKVAIRLSTRLARERKLRGKTKPQVIIKGGETIVMDPSSDTEDEDRTEEYVIAPECSSERGTLTDKLATRLSSAFVLSAEPPQQVPPSAVAGKLETTGSTRTEDFSLNGNKHKVGQEHWHKTRIKKTSHENDPPSRLGKGVASASSAPTTTSKSAKGQLVTTGESKQMRPNTTSFAHNNTFEILESLTDPSISLASASTSSKRQDTTNDQEEDNNNDSDSGLLILSEHQDTKHDNEAGEHGQQHYIEASEPANDPWPEIHETPLTAEELSRKADRMAAKGELMPRWDGEDGIWQVLGNRLVVTASEEGVCVL